MMQSTAGFAGLTPPVFNAFGWAGEEAALKFAFEQLHLFINTLYARLPREAQDRFPSFGLSGANQNVYLAAASDVTNDIYIEFNARPMSLELQLCLTDDSLLTKALRHADRDPVGFQKLISDLGPDWSLRVQQLQIDDESGEASHYQDLFKDAVDQLDEEKAKEVMSRAAYLNGEGQWNIPVYISRRYSSDQASAMGDKIIDVLGQDVMSLLPLVSFLTGKKKKKATKAKPEPKPEPVAPAPVAEEVFENDEEGFSYVAVLRALHLRRGFVNMTPEHWPFFAINSRSTIRDVTVQYADNVDKESSVWRLVPNDQARLVLSPAVHQWLEDYFNPNDKIQVVARKLKGDEIQITLASAA